MSEEIEMLKGSLDTLMSAVRTRDYKKVSEIVEEIKKNLDELKLIKELEIYKEFYDKTKEELLNIGKSNIIQKSVIDKIRIEMGNKIEELKNGDGKI